MMARYAVWKTESEDLVVLGGREFKVQFESQLEVKYHMLRTTSNLILHATDLIVLTPQAHAKDDMVSIAFDVK